MIILEVKDKTGRQIRLTKEMWKHIVEEDHRVSLEEIEKAIAFPERINQSDKDSNPRFYYKYNKVIKRRLLVSIRYLNGKGFVVTAFYTPKIY